MGDIENSSVEEGECFRIRGGATSDEEEQLVSIRRTTISPHVLSLKVALSESVSIDVFALFQVGLLFQTRCIQRADAQSITQFGLPPLGFTSSEGPPPAFAFSESDPLRPTDDVVASISIFHVQTQERKAWIDKSQGAIGLLGPASGSRTLDGAHLCVSIISSSIKIYIHA